MTTNDFGFHIIESTKSTGIAKNGPRVRCWWVVDANGQPVGHRHMTLEGAEEGLRHAVDGMRIAKAESDRYRW